MDQHWYKRRNMFGNFQLHRFTTIENIAKFFEGRGLFFDSHCMRNDYTHLFSHTTTIMTFRSINPVKVSERRHIVQPRCFFKNLSRVAVVRHSVTRRRATNRL